MINFIGDNTQYDNNITSIYLLFVSAYLGFNKIAKFQENYEIHSKTANKTLQSAIKQAQQIAAKNASCQSNIFGKSGAYLFLGKEVNKVQAQNRKKAAVVTYLLQN